MNGSRTSDAIWLIVDAATGLIVDLSMHSGSILKPGVVSFVGFRVDYRLASQGGKRCLVPIERALHSFLCRDVAVAS